MRVARKGYPFVDLSQFSEAQIAEAWRYADRAVRMRVSLVAAHRSTTDKSALPQLPDDVIFAVCDRIAEGETLRDICRDDAMPRLSHLLAIAAENKVVGRLLEQAMRMRALAFGDEVVQEAESVRGSDNSAEVAAARLIADSKKWYAGKLMPNLFGEKPEDERKLTVNVVLRRFESDPIEVKGE